jgi:hypothetical protein
MTGPQVDLVGSAPGIELVAVRTLLEPGFDTWFRLAPGDRLLVSAGEDVEIGQSLAIPTRDPAIREIRMAREADGARVQPGTPWHASPTGARRADGERAGEHLFELGGRWRVVAGEPAEPLESPLNGTVVEARPGIGIRIRTAAQALRGVVALGGPVRGALQVATTAAGELRASSIDVGRSGLVLVAGAKIDAEALTRARAMGVRGVVVGGLPSKERRDFLASESRQRAARQRLPPFAVLVMEGTLRRPIAGPVMAVLEALEGQDVAILADPPALAVAVPIGDVVAPAADVVRIRSGPLLGRSGRWAGLAGRRRFPGGVDLEAGLVELDSEQRIAVPIGDLERFA